MNAGVLAAIGIGLLLTGLVSSIAGGGGGPLIIIIMQIFLGTQLAIAAAAIPVFVLLVAKSWQFRKYADWHAALHYSILGLPATFAGGVLLFHVPIRFIEILFSMVCLSFVAFRILKPNTTMKPTKTRFWVFGLFNGFFGGLVGNTGIVMLMIISSMGYTKERLVATTAVIGLILEFAKIAAYVPYIEWSPPVIRVILVSIPMLIIGTYFGKHALHNISKRGFEICMLSVIAFGALRLLLYPS